MPDDPTTTAKIQAHNDGLSPESSSEFGRAFSKGLIGIPETGARFLEALSDIVGAKGAKEWWKEKGDTLQQLNEAIPLRIDSISKVDPTKLADWGAYAAAAVGQLVPQIALSLGAGGLAARGAATASQALARGAAGAIATTYPQEAGAIYGGVRDETGVEAPGTALTFGAASAALEALTPARLIAKIFDGPSEALKRGTWRALARGSLNEAAKTATTEGVTEAAQESIALAANKFADGTYDLINGKNFIRVLDAGLMGAIGGGLIGSTVPFAQRAEQKQEVSEDDQRILPAQGPASFYDFIRQFSVKPSKTTESDPAYVYHATNQERAADIATEGKLNIFPPDYGTDQNVWPDGETAARSYWSPKANVVWQFAPDEGRPVILRTKMSDALKRESTGDVYATAAIPSANVEILTKDGWHPLVAKPLAAMGPAVKQPTAKQTPEFIQESIQDLLDRYPDIKVKVTDELTKDQIRRNPGAQESGLKAFFDPMTGETVLRPSRIESANEARELFFHEITHKGLTGTIKNIDELNQLERILTSAERHLLANANPLAQKLGFRDLSHMLTERQINMNQRGGRMLGLEELIAIHAQEFANKKAPTWWKKLVGNIKAWLGGIFRFDIGDDGVDAIIRRAHSKASAPGRAAVTVSPELRPAMTPTLKPQDIANTALLAGPTSPNLEIEGRIATAQVTDMENMVRPAIDAVPQNIRSKVERQTLGDRLSGINAYVRDLLQVSPTNFETAMQQESDPGIRNLISLHLDRWMNFFELNARNAQQRAKRLTDELLSPSTQRAIDRLSSAMNRKEVTEYSKKRISTQLKNGLDAARRRAAESSGNETIFNEAQEEVRYYEELISRNEQLNQLMWRIITTLGIYPASAESFFAGSQLSARDIERMFTEQVGVPAASTDGYGNRRNPDLAMIRIAAGILARNSTMARRMMTATWAEDAAVTASVNTIEDQFREAHNNRNVRQLTDLLLRRSQSLASNAGKATEIIRMRKLKLAKLIENAEAAQVSSDILQRVLASPQYNELRRNVAAVTGDRIVPTVASRPGEAAEFGGKNLPLWIESAFTTTHEVALPDGTNVTLKMTPSKKQWDEQANDLKTALDKLSDWLAVEANAASPYYEFYMTERNQLQALWNSSAAWNPPKTTPAFRNVHLWMTSWLKLFDPLLGNIGTRSANLVRSAASMWKDSNHLFGEWQRGFHNEFIKRHVAAIRSHPEIMRDQHAQDANREWFETVYSPLVASWNDPTGARYRAGQIIAETGAVVTEEDFKAMQRDSIASSKAHRINVMPASHQFAIPNLVEDDFIPGAPFMRQALKLSRFMLPRRIGATGRTVAQEYMNDVVSKLDPADTPDAKASNAQLKLDFWNRHFNAVRAMVAQRNPEFSTVSPYEPAFKEAAADLGTETTEIGSVEDLTQFMSERLDAEPEDIMDFILNEMNRNATAVGRMFIESQDKRANITELHAIDQTTPFTTGRGKLVAPTWWYDYGWRDSKALMDFSMQGSAFYLAIFQRSIKSMAQELRDYKAKVDANLIQLRKHAGDTKGRQLLKASNRANLKLGEELVYHEQLTDAIRALDAYADYIGEQFKPGGRESDAAVSGLRRAFSTGIAGVLFSYATTVRNAWEGGFLVNGIRLSRLQGSAIKAFPKVALEMFKTLVPLSVKTPISLVKGAGTVIRSIPKATKTLFQTGSILKAESDLFGEAVQQIADSLFELNDMTRQLEKRGVSIRVTPQETIANIADLWQTAGFLTPTRVSDNPVAKTWFYSSRALGALIDAQMVLFAKPFFPRLGDKIANDVVANTAISTLHNMENRLRRIHANMVEAGIDPASMPRQLTPKELFKSFLGLAPTSESLREWEKWFTESGHDFHDTAIAFLRELSSNPETARWLTDEQQMDMAERNVEIINAATPLNRPLITKKNIATEMAGALMGWYTNSFFKFLDYVGSSTMTDKKAFQVKLAIGLWLVAILPWLSMGNQATEFVLRYLAKMFGEGERATRLPHEFEETGEQVKSHILYGLNAIPFVATAANAAFNDMPTKASFSPYLLVQNKVVDLMNYVGGAVNSRDPTHGLNQLLRGFVPMSNVVLSKLPSTEGLYESASVKRLYTRYGDALLLNRPGGGRGPGASANVTPLTPYGDRIANALARGDTASAKKYFEKGIEVATSLGKADPEQSVKQMVMARMPLARAFKSAPSPQQYSHMLGRMTDGERQYVEAFNDRVTSGLSRLGMQTTRLSPTAAISPTRSSGRRFGSFTRSRRPTRAKRLTSRSRSRRLAGRSIRSTLAA